MSDLYVQGALVIDGVLTQRGSLKGLVTEHSRSAKIDAKRLLALTANTLAFRKALEHALLKANIETIERKALQTAVASKGTACPPKSLALVLAHDLLLTKRARIATSPAWPPNTAITRHATRLRAELVKLQIQQGKSSIYALRAGDESRKKAERIPRWIRINERLITVDAAVQQLKQEGWREVQNGSELHPKSKTFARSRHVGCVFAVHFAHTSYFVQHPMYEQGRLILQDLASCFPAEILLESDVTPTSVIHALDATAAPGNKTSHLSAKLANAARGSKVTAFEHSKARFETLQKQLRRAGALSQDKPGFVTAVLGDFTKQEPLAYKDVTHMLLDPSCSGSGILGRLDYLTEEQDENGQEEKSEGDRQEQQQQRLKGLAAFQSAMIEHAMHFPALKRLVYSTCSIHSEENEEVVMRAIASEVARSGGWTLAQREQVIPSWRVRGLASHCDDHHNETLANGMIRCVPGGIEDGSEGVTGEPNLDATNGFFVACFVRASDFSSDGLQSVSETKTKKDNSAKNRKRKLQRKEKLREKKARFDVQ